MQNQAQKLKGFTLLEILIATTLFVSVLVITMGIVGQSASFGTKILTQKNVSEETRRLNDLLSRDIRSAKSVVKIATGNTTLQFRNGLAQFECNNSCLVSNNALPAEIDLAGIKTNANTLIIASDASYKIYLSDLNSEKNPHVYYKEIAFSSLKDNTLPITEIPKIKDPANIINSNKTETRIYLSGFCPDTTHDITQQPFVQYYIDARTAGFDSLRVQDRAEASLRSLVTARSY